MAINTTLEKALAKILKATYGQEVLSINSISLEGESDSNCCCESNSVSVYMNIQYSTEVSRWSYHNVDEYDINIFLEELTEAIVDVHAESLGLVTLPEEK